MILEPRRNEPLYSCIVPVESITGNQEEELISFGNSASAARNQAEQMLADNYRCNIDGIKKLMELARIEYLSPWCSQR
ncbi:MAG: hypothetical protein QNJ54_07360 [Prochloraceae cyanobacterium]|nr:hypothetical protein [Prochloraceae cyanobacterium]